MGINEFTGCSGGKPVKYQGKGYIIIWCRGQTSPSCIMNSLWCSGSYVFSTCGKKKSLHPPSFCQWSNSSTYTRVNRRLFTSSLICVFKGNWKTSYMRWRLIYTNQPHIICCKPGSAASGTEQFTMFRDSILINPMIQSKIDSNKTDLYLGSKC